MSDLTDEDEEAIRILLHLKAHMLTEWEVSFLKNITEQGWMSVAQRGIFNRVWERAMNG